MNTSLAFPRAGVRAWMGSRFTRPLHRRSAVVTGALLLAAFVLTLLALTTGGYAMRLLELAAVAWGRADVVHRFVLLDLRLPRALVALLAGAALATAGAIFQSLSRNPLASPDIIGFSAGSATGALVVILLLGERATSVPVGALVGGAIAAAVVYVVAARRGLQTQRLILVGIAIAAMLAAVNDYLLTRADLDQALQAKMWLHGSLQASAWPQVTLLALGCAVLLPIAWCCSATLRLLEMGDDVASSLGVAVGRSKLGLSLLAVACTALATASAGPIGFVALASPQLARRLCRSPGIGLLSSAAMGACLCALADLVARHALAPFQIPVGLVTSALGGAYMVYLLSSQWRRSGG